MTFDEILATLETGVFDPLVGIEETQEIEFKRQPYDLDSKRSLYEFAKDISGLANATGGIIVIGVATRRSAVSRLDIAESVSPFERALVDEERCRDLFRSRIYPEIDRIAINWFPCQPSNGRGLFGIIVPRQPDERKYFLIREPTSDDDEEDRSDSTPGYVFGLSLRSGPDVVPFGIEDIYFHVRDGRSVFARLDGIDNRLRIIEDHLQVAPRVDDQLAADERLLQRLNLEANE